MAGDFVEDYGVMVPFQTLRTVGHEVHAVRPEKSADDQVKTPIHDSEDDRTYAEKPGHDFTLNHDFDAVGPEEYDALVVPEARPGVPPDVRRYSRDRPTLLRGRESGGGAPS